VVPVPTKIILDCDPGHDDAVAMLLAWGNPDIQLVGVTTVVGNQTLEKVTRNALSVARVAGITGVPFAAGSARPLVREIETAGEIHGESGLDGPVLPEPTIALDPRPAAQFIVDTIMAAEPGEITLVPTGGLTNIAIAARLDPRIIPRVKQVVLMGGGVQEGNWSAVAEFNIVIDPEAAAIVFDAGWPVTMVGLDVTHQAIATPAVTAAIAAVGTRPAAFVGELMTFFEKAYQDAQGFPHPPVHDPVAVAFVIDPTLVRVVRAPISVETRGEHTLGMTVVDLRSPAPADCVTQVTFDLDAERFWTLVVDALERIGEVEP
jgi:purine nucleosidase